MQSRTFFFLLRGAKRDLLRTALSALTSPTFLLHCILPLTANACSNAQQHAHSRPLQLPDFSQLLYVCTRLRLPCVCVPIVSTQARALRHCRCQASHS